MSGAAVVLVDCVVVVRGVTGRSGVVRAVVVVRWVDLPVVALAVVVEGSSSVYSSGVTGLGLEVMGLDPSVSKSSRNVRKREIK